MNFSGSAHFMRDSLFILFIYMSLFSGCRQPSTINQTGNQEDKDWFLADLKQRTFQYFWDLADTNTWQIPDRYPTHNFTSVAATGFGLPAYIIGIENNYISRDTGAERVLKTIEWLWNSNQGPESANVTGYHGFYYHFLNYNDGYRYRNTELSTIDTGLLLAGILTCQSYFDSNNSTESRIRELSDSLYLRVEWDWAMNGEKTMSMGWHPEKGFIKSRWSGYNEAMILIIMALGSPTYPIPEDAWQQWCETYDWAKFQGYEMVNFSPLFGHQYSHMFIDFRDIRDAYMREKGIDYFENSRRATLSNRAYCIENPKSFKGYGENIWGLTACDGPSGEIRVINGDSVRFWKYRARGASALNIIDDGTIAPTAAGGSIPFAPEKCINALLTFRQKLGKYLYKQYGFKDAFNQTYTFGVDMKNGWVDDDYIGIDQGPIIIQLENYQTQLIWNIIKRNKYIIRGLKKAGFTGGWLDSEGQI